jgi:hypothetical protein
MNRSLVFDLATATSLLNERTLCFLVHRVQAKVIWLKPSA